MDGLKIAMLVIISLCFIMLVILIIPKISLWIELRKHRKEVQHLLYFMKRYGGRNPYDRYDFYEIKSRLDNISDGLYAPIYIIDEVTINENNSKKADNSMANMEKMEKVDE